MGKRNKVKSRRLVKENMNMIPQYYLMIFDVDNRCDDSDDGCDDSDDDGDGDGCQED